MTKHSVFRTSMIAVVIAGASLMAPVVFSQTAAPTADQKIKQLKGCVDHFNQAQKGWSQEPDTQAAYQEKIDNAQRMIKKLEDGKDIDQAKIDKACESPHAAPY
jgi:hypothetical protein